MTHLELLNSFLALRLRQQGWPAVLESGGYAIHTIGVGFRLPDGSNISPDAIASSLERRVALLVEVKGGRNLDHDQLGRMRRVSPDDLRDYGHIPIRSLEEFRVSILYFCNEEHRTELERQAEERASVVGFDGTRFRIGGAPLHDSWLAQALEAARVSEDTPPARVIPFDRESPHQEIARAVLPVLVAFLVRGTSRFTVEEVLQHTHQLVYGSMRSTGSGSELGEVRRHVNEVLRILSRNELGDWIAQMPGQQQGGWQFTRALSTEQAIKTRELQSLARAATLFLARAGEDVEPLLPFPELEE